MIAWSYMEYEELVLKNVLLAQQKRRKNAVIINSTKYSLQGTTQGRYLTGGVPPVRFSM